LNPLSGGGKVQHFHLVGEARARGIEPVVLQRGDDVSELARAAASRGAAMIGMAGGDGSQAQVATVASELDLPYVCVPAGTRNHFALDIGLDPRDVVGALDAFSEGSERHIDLATVNGRVFVNNVSLGFYGRVVQSKEYRAAKFRTVIEMLPELLGPGAAPFDLRFTSPDRSLYSGVQLLLVSNNRYAVDLREPEGTRGKMDHGVLGVVVVTGSPLPVVREWTTPELGVDSAKMVEAGVDGEAVTFEPPLLFASLPGALRIRLPTRLRVVKIRPPAKIPRWGK
jgi:diacylglycerol kinase family enzyme